MAVRECASNYVSNARKTARDRAAYIARGVALFFLLLPLLRLLSLLPCLLRAPALVAAPHVPTVCFFGKEECVQKHKLLFHLLSCSLFKQKALH